MSVDTDATPNLLLGSSVKVHVTRQEKERQKSPVVDNPAEIAHRAMYAVPSSSSSISEIGLLRANFLLG